MQSTIPVPKEDEEQATLVQYLQLKGIKHFRVPSETYTTSWKQKAKNKALGVVKGVPDMFVLTNTGLIAIEMKRASRSLSTVSPEQKDWITSLNDAGVASYVAYGAGQAIEIVEHHNRT